MAVKLGTHRQSGAGVRDTTVYRPVESGEPGYGAARNGEGSIASKSWTAADLFALPISSREPILREMAELLAPLYEADLARPVEFRELTALTALDGVDEIFDRYEVDSSGTVRS